MLLFNRPIRGQLPEMNRKFISINSDDAQYEVLIPHQKLLRTMILAMAHFLFSTESTVAIQCEDGGP